MMAPSASSADRSHALERLDFSDLEGWSADNHAEALAAFRLSCDEILSEGSGFRRRVLFGGARGDWTKTCRAARDATEPRAFFEKHFRPYRVVDGERPDGLFTGYYEPEAEGSLSPDDEHTVALYRKPPDLVAFPEDIRERTGLAFGRWHHGEPRSYFTRREIEEGVLAGQGLEIVWLRDWADAFFIHVQGSGRIRLKQGGTLRLSYAAKSGHPYTAIGGILVDRGAIPREQLSMQAIRSWMDGNPDEARALMWENASFIFFREIELADDGLGALGAQQVQLTPRRSIAVDRAYWMLGTPVWLETEALLRGGAALQPYQSLLIAQDTGSAIKGLSRGDVYWGFGEEAARIAGPMKSAGRMVVLLPHAVARRLDLPR